MLEDEEERLRLLRVKASKLTDNEAAGIREKLLVNPSDSDLRFLLLSYFEHHSIRGEACDAGFFEQVCWFIDHASDNLEYLNFSSHSPYSKFLDSQNLHIKNLWLEQAKINSNNGSIVGFAGLFVIWTDFEEGEKLLQKAMKLAPTNRRWIGALSVHHHSQFWRSEGEKKREFAKISMKTNLESVDVAPWMSHEYAAECALFLEDYRQVEFSARGLFEVEHPYFDHLANVFLGLIAIRENNCGKAVRLLLKRGTRKFEPNRFSWQLVSELFALGERKSLIKYIDSMERKVPKRTREKLIQKIRENICPDFEKEL